MANDRIPDPAELRRKLVDVLRCDEGEEFWIKPLSNKVAGLFTHHIRKRSEYCPGEKCSCQHRKEKRIWKGYVPVEVYRKDAVCWESAVWEVTENAEHCISGKQLKGFVWRVFRKLPDDLVKSYPVQVERQEPFAEKHLPLAFDWQPVMMRKFHCLERLEDHHKNPLPPPTILAVSMAPPPAKIAQELQAAGAPPDEETVKVMREQIAGFLKRNKVEEGSKNGAH